MVCMFSPCYIWRPPEPLGAWYDFVQKAALPASPAYPTFCPSPLLSDAGDNGGDNGGDDGRSKVVSLQQDRVMGL